MRRPRSRARRLRGEAEAEAAKERVAASVEDEHAVGQINELRNFGRMEQHRPSGVCVRADEAIEFVLGADVYSASRVKQQENPAFSEQPFGDGDLLVGSSRVDLQACKLEYSIVSPK